MANNTRNYMILLLLRSTRIDTVLPVLVYVKKANLCDY